MSTAKMCSQVSKFSKTRNSPSQGQNQGSESSKIEVLVYSIVGFCRGLRGEEGGLSAINPRPALRNRNPKSWRGWGQKCVFRLDSTPCRIKPETKNPLSVLISRFMHGQGCKKGVNWIFNSEIARLDATVLHQSAQ
jgi:hypothetical protein